MAERREGGGCSVAERRTSNRALRFVTLVLVAIVVVVAPAALAANVLSHKAGYNATVTFNKFRLTTVFSNAFSFNNANNIAPTDISPVVYTNTESWKETNVFDSNWGSGFYGLWYCNQWDPYSQEDICLDGRVWLNLFYAPYTDTEARSLICEEIGHAVGLAHSSESASCMSQQWDKTLLASHDRSHLNAKY